MKKIRKERQNDDKLISLCIRNIKLNLNQLHTPDYAGPHADKTYGVAD